MKWKKFDEIPPVGKEILIRFRLLGFTTVEFSEIERPYNKEPKKYREDYYRIKRISVWQDLDSQFLENFEWLNPNEDIQ